MSIIVVTLMMFFLARFDYLEVVGTVIDQNRAVCIQPFIMAEGPIRFEISINSGTYNWKGKYFVGEFLYASVSFGDSIRPCDEAFFP